LDPDVNIGVLENGITYYVRENQRPGRRAQLRLVINAGSVLEDAEQSGSAHFLEHMLFNGTERFPVNELTRVLESFGARFGPDVNAYTSFDETVYELAVATDDPALLELALDVLLEWATRATITQEDVVEERGVVLEEWRLRDAGVSGRVAQLYENVFLAGTAYEGNAPIGDPDALRTTNADVLQRFYADWYRPDLMAVVAVGDFDDETVIDLIEERFAPLPAPAAQAREHPVIDVPPAVARRVAVLADPDQTTSSVEIYYSGPTLSGHTVGDRRAAWAELFATDMIATRLSDDVSRGVAPYLSVDATEFDFTRSLGVSGLAAEVASADILEAAAGLVIEMERALLYGFNDTEFDRSRDGWRAGIDQVYASRASTQDVEFAGRYVAHFLGGAPIPSAEQEFAMDTELLDSLTKQDAQDALVALLAGSAVKLVALGPDDGTVPSEADLETALDAALAATIQPRSEEAAVGDTLLEPPDPVEPIETIALPLGITELVYSNGVRVRYVETEIAANQLVMSASSSGGLSLVPDADVPEALLISEIVGRSGAGSFDRVALDTFLADKVVFVQPFIDATREGIFGGSATEDFESLMQLIHLIMVAPRADDAAAAAVIGEFRPFAEAPERIPGLATTLELIDRRWGDDRRFAIVLDEAEIDEFDVAAGLAAFKSRFGDAGDFVFSFAGDFSPGTILDLANSYLGTLPGTDRDDSWVDFQQAPPPGAVDVTVAAGDSEQGFVTFLFTADYVRDARGDIQIELLGLITDVRLRDRLREALAATYSPIFSIAASDEPDSLLETFVQVSGDPALLDVIAAETLATVRSLAQAGPTEDEMRTAREQLTRQYELISNEWWVDQMIFFAERPDESLSNILDRVSLIDETTSEEIRRLAAVAFPQGQYILVRQIPE